MYVNIIKTSDLRKGKVSDKLVKYTIKKNPFSPTSFTCPVKVHSQAKITVHTISMFLLYFLL